jgi:hypothetical protein
VEECSKSAGHGIRVIDDHMDVFGVRCSGSNEGIAKQRDVVRRALEFRVTGSSCRERHQERAHPAAIGRRNASSHRFRNCCFPL